MAAFLAFDCGATSGRSILATLDRDSLSMREIHRFPDPIVQKDGKLYWDVYAIIGSFKEALRKVADEGIQLTSLGIDTWGVDFGLLGKDGQLLELPRCYRDHYTDGIPQEVFGIIPHRELYGATGIQILNFNSIFQLYAQKKEGSEALAKASELLFMPDLLSYLLTGSRICEYTDASTSGLMNQAKRCFEREFLGRMGINSGILKDIVPSGTRVGTLKPEFGLGPVPVVAVAGHDTASAIAAVPAENQQFAYLSSGTWSLMGIETESPIITAESESLNFTNEGGIEGTTRFLKNITGMWLIERCRAVWKAQGKDYSYPELARMAEQEKDFPGRINPDDPRFAAPENMVKEIADQLGNEGMGDAQIVSCIYHSLCDRYKEVLNMLQGFAPFKIEKLHVIGGGSANDLMNQWTADALGIPVVAGPVEATAIGNIMLQAKAAGLVQDRWHMRRIISEAFKVKQFNPS